MHLQKSRSAARRAGDDVAPRCEPSFSQERPVGAVLKRENRRWLIRTPRLRPDIAFLAERGVPKAVLDLAARLAASRGTDARAELFAIGFDRERYWSLLADHLGLARITDFETAELVLHPDARGAEILSRVTSVLVRFDGEVINVQAPNAEEMPRLVDSLVNEPGHAERIRIASPEAIRAFLAARRQTALSALAVDRLWRSLPRLSARRLGGGGERPVVLVSALTGLALLAPTSAIEALTLLAVVFFANCSYWRLATAFGEPDRLRMEALSGDLLPSYTVLAPLYREAAVIPDLIGHLTRLDYPASKLQIVIVLEADDAASRAAVARTAGAANVEVVIVPPGGPRTKPKALSYALAFARGDLVTVYDAEDRPERDQLRKAAAAFHDHPHLGCVQARLTPDNRESWLARMFGLEYASTFEVLLPALAARRMPLPLGGTSNHFRRAVLDEVGGWDPYNVTEDADLGIRLARFGYASGTIRSRTYEEAPVRFGQWLPQRRRWIKGWMQTALICRPRRLPKGLQLARRESLAVHGIITAGIFGLLLYPLSILSITLATWRLAQGSLSASEAWLLAAFNVNFACVLLAAVVSALRGLREQGRLRSAGLILTLPFYWALMSLAAWQALWQLIHDPSNWEKTRHGVARRRRTPDLGGRPA